MSINNILTASTSSSGESAFIDKDVIAGTTMTVETTPIPVPAAVWLFGSALGLLGWVRRRTA